MRIVSTIARQGSGAHVLVFDTFADAKHLICAVLESPDGGANVSEIGQRVLDVAGGYHQAHQDRAGTKGAVHSVAVMAGSVARKQVLRVFAAAKPGDLVLFFGLNDGVCAELIKVLGVQRTYG